MSDPVDWDARAYHRVAAPQEEWGREVLARLELRGDETVLDAGCGSGRVTRLLCERVPDGRVIGVDGSPSMIEHAGENLAEFGDRVELIVGDLLDARAPGAGRRDLLQRDLPLDPRPRAAVRAPVRGPAPRRRDRGAVRGQGQRRRVEARARVAAGRRALRRLPARHARGDQLRLGRRHARPARAGRVRARPDRRLARARTVAPPDRREFARTVSLAKHLALLPEGLRDEFVDAVLGSMPRPLVLEYVRLNISARRPALMGTTIVAPARGRDRPRDRRRGAPGARRGRRVRLRRAADRRRLDRRPRDAAHRRGPRSPAERPTRSCSAPSAARSGTPPIPTRRGPSRGCSACARASGCSRTCGRSSPARPWSPPARCARR